MYFNKGVRLEGLSLFVLRALEIGQITEAQIEAARKIVKRKIKKKGILHVRAYPFLNLVRKPAEVRMGKGKGSRPRGRIFPVRPGQVLFQLSGVSSFNAVSALKSAANKLAVKVAVFGFLKT